jgi:hypothetical protein
MGTTTSLFTTFHVLKNISLFYLRTLGINSLQGADTIFGTIFFIMWVGSAIIT